MHAKFCAQEVIILSRLSLRWFSAKFAYAFWCAIIVCFNSTINAFCCSTCCSNSATLAINASTTAGGEAWHIPAPRLWLLLYVLPPLPPLNPPLSRRSPVSLLTTWLEICLSEDGHVLWTTRQQTEDKKGDAPSVDERWHTKHDGMTMICEEQWWTMLLFGDYEEVIKEAI